VIGFGTVGTGTVKMLVEERDLLREQVGVNFELVGVADLDVTRDRGVRLPKGILTKDAGELIDRKDVNVVVELIGGIEPARSFILRAIRAGHHVVTANKHLLAVHGRELFSAARERGVSIGFEASVCGGVPVISALRDGLVANRITSITGIVNGTSNYILTRMSSGGVTYGAALAEAQAAGYAEADPTFDVEGRDSAHKLAILSALAFGDLPEAGAFHVEGITAVEPDDIRYARELGYAVKLLAIGRMREGGRAELRVHPALVPASGLLAAVPGAMNAVRFVGDATGPIILYGQGAGMMPTASAVVSDLAAVARGTAEKVFARMRFVRGGGAAGECVPQDEVRTRYFMRFMVRDEFRVLGRIAMALGEAGVSIDSCIQKETKPDSSVPIVVMTHEAREGDALAAVKRIDAMEFAVRPTRFIRVEEDAGL